MLCTYFLSTFATVNHCCAYHDDCYSLQRGQATCDHEFCGCLQHVSEGSPTICNILIMGKCELVSSFGISTYERSKKEAMPSSNTSESARFSARIKTESTTSSLFRIV
ncbi:hypothetical protein RB195_018042 [Necator americanus]|uniref:Phospholipase A2 n=1 Tax=Necator americanus TaxID=51031 RepID=A0ABR1CAU8_NECAM